MRVIECNECGCALSAANDDELRRELTRHMEAEHADAEWDEESSGELVSQRAYSATDS